MRIIPTALRALFFIGFSSLATAAVYEPLSDVLICDDVTVACEAPTGFILGAQYYGVLGTSSDYLGNMRSIFSAIVVEAGWQFAEGFDVLATWIGQFENVASHAFIDDTVRLAETHHIVNLEFGKQVYAGARTDLRFHLGAQYLYVHRDFRTDPKASQEFNGAGPRMGIQGSQWLFPCIALEAGAAASVLAGDSVATDTSTQRGLSFGADTYVQLKWALDRMHPAWQVVPIDFVGGYRWYQYNNVMNNGPLGQGKFGAHGFYAGFRTTFSRLTYRWPPY